MYDKNIEKQNDPEEENLPAEVSRISIREFESLDPNASLDKIVEVDTEITNDMLRAVHGMFPKVQTIKTACTLIATTMKVLEQRRKILLLKHAPQGNIPIKGPLFPLS